MKKNMANVGVIVQKTRASDSPEAQQPPEHEAAIALINAVHAKNAQGVIDAMRDLQSILSAPAEGELPGDES